MNNLIQGKVLTFTLLLASIILISGCKVSLGTGTQVDKEFTIVDNADIDISMEVGDVSVDISPDDKVYLSYYEYNYIEFALTESETGFSIKQVIDASLIHMDNIRGVTILVPAKQLRNFNIKVDVGDITIQGISTKTTDVTLDVGNIALDKLTSDNITLQTDVGNVRGSVVGNKADFNIRTETDIGYRNPENSGSALNSKSLKITVDVGNISVSFTE